jgi:hypothetical protein
MFFKIITFTTMATDNNVGYEVLATMIMSAIF